MENHKVCVCEQACEEIEGRGDSDIRADVEEIMSSWAFNAQCLVISTQQAQLDQQEHHCSLCTDMVSYQKYCHFMKSYAHLHIGHA